MIITDHRIIEMDFLHITPKRAYRLYSRWQKECRDTKMNQEKREKAKKSKT